MPKPVQVSEPPKKRGRPKKNVDAPVKTVKTDTQEPPKKRGRPPKNAGTSDNGKHVTVVPKQPVNTDTSLAVPSKNNQLQTNRLKLEKDMTPELKKEANWVLNHINKASTFSLKFFWELGQRISVILANEKRYGSRSVEKLAAYIGYEKEALYKARHFFSDFTHEELEDLLTKRVKSTGNMLTWAHVGVLITIDDKKKRQKVIEYIVNEGVSADELSKKLHKDAGTKPHAGGRPIKVPAKLEGRFNNLEKVLSVFNRNHTTIYVHNEHGLLQSVKDLSPDKITKDIFDHIDTSINLLEDAKANIEEELVDLQDARETALKRKNGKTNQQKVDEEVEDDADQVIESSDHKVVNEVKQPLKSKPLEWKNENSEEDEDESEEDDGYTEYEETDEDEDESEEDDEDLYQELEGEDEEE